MKPLYILKIGGSVATYKDRSGFSVRRLLLKKIASAIKNVQKEKNFGLILIHGAGAAGHQLAKRYGLQGGVAESKKKWHGAFLSRFANQKLSVAIAESLYKGGLRIVSVHTASMIVQKKGRIANCNLRTIRDALDSECLPLLYGEMVFDKSLGMSICSGDAIAPYLAKKLKAEKIFFATDTDGIFDKDPHKNRNAKLVECLPLKNARGEIELTDSHNMDVTGGMKGKIKKLAGLSESIKTIEIFNGLKPGNYKKALMGEKFPHTIIVYK